jgi:hypothetical protein
MLSAALPEIPPAGTIPQLSRPQRPIETRTMHRSRWFLSLVSLLAELLLMDEPLASLDAQLKQRILS